MALAGRVAAVFSNTVRLCGRYHLEPNPQSLVLFRALRRERAGDGPPDWSPYVRSDSTIIDLPCTHADLISPSFAPTIASQLEPHLARRP